MLTSVQWWALRTQDVAELVGVLPCCTGGAMCIGRSGARLCTHCKAGKLRSSAICLMHVCFMQEIVRDVVAFADVQESITPRDEPLLSSSETSPLGQLPDLSPEGYSTTLSHSATNRMAEEQCSRHTDTVPLHCLCFHVSHVLQSDLSYEHIPQEHNLAASTQLWAPDPDPMERVPRKQNIFL